MKILGIKKFNREMYKHLKELPILVINEREKRPIFIVLPPDQIIIDTLKGGDTENGISTKNLN